jgi:hypothetical protein
VFEFEQPVPIPSCAAARCSSNACRCSGNVPSPCLPLACAGRPRSTLRTA